jgi:4-hydroxy-tetrahydrodipicolinate synthase
MAAATVARCAEVDNIVGIKEATGDMNRACDVIRRCPANFAILSGDDFTAMSLVLLGGTGVISVLSNVHPKGMSNLINAALAGDVAGAREIQYRLFPLMGAMFYDTNPVPAKKALELMGKIQSGTPRQPLWQMGEDPLNRLKAVLKDQGLI